MKTYHASLTRQQENILQIPNLTSKHVITTNVLKGKQTVMGFGTYGKEAYSNKHVKVEQNKQRIRVF